MIEPNSETELSDAIAGASAPFEIVGGGTRLALGRPVQAAASLSTARLAGIRLYEPGALTLVAGAGTPLAEIEAALAEENQRLAFEPMDHRALLGSSGAPTIGGVVACNVSGPRRIQAGAARDALLGVRFVDGRGRILKNGGRVMKNVTGYDLVKLMAGGYGTLGVLTEVAFKVLPAAEAAATVLIEGLSDNDAVAAMTRALGSPYDVSGAAHFPVSMDGPPVTMIRVEGFAKSVAYRARKLRELLGGVVETDPARVAAGWRWVRDAEALATRPGAVWRISVKPSDGPRVVAAVPHDFAFYDWGGGLVWLLVPEAADASAAAIRGAVARHGGHATLVRASDATRAAVAPFQPEPAPLAAISAGLRAKFDPRGLLNPGRMGG